MKLADKLEGRTIHITMDVWVRPPEEQELGSSDAAVGISRGILDQVRTLLNSVKDKEGFSLKIKAKQVII